MILKVWIDESEAYLRDLIKSESNSVTRDKLTILLYIKLNKVTEINELSDLLNRHRNTIARWLDNYRTGGLKSVLQIKQRDKFEPAIINGNNLEKLIAKLSGPEGFNSYYEIQDWLKQECDLDVKYATIHHTVRYKLKAKLKVARPTNIKKDLDKELAFKKNL